MATIGHVAVGLAGARLFAPQALNRRHLIWAMAFLSLSALAPDADVVAFALGIPYAAPWGHRGAAHSLLFGATVGLATGALFPIYGAARVRSMLAVALVTASHGPLDSLTNGGLGIALFWPLTNVRWFAPWRPLPVAPIGSGMLSSRGLTVLLYETLLFAPLLLYALWPRKPSELWRSWMATRSAARSPVPARRSARHAPPATERPGRRRHR